MITLNIGLIKKANAYRQANEHTAGVVVFFDNEISGWMNELRDPQSWQPGCIAIDENGKQWVARDGNPYDGAERWAELQITPEEFEDEVNEAKTKLEIDN